MKCISLFKRLLILLYESFLLLAIYVAVGTPITVYFKIILDPSASVLQQPKYILYLLYIFTVFYFYFCFCWMRGGQTLAMKAWRCKVINSAGENISHQQALLRYLGGVFSLALFGGGFLIALFRNDNATLHDLLSKSYIVAVPKTSNNDE